jgi:hypothetical protein
MEIDYNKIINIGINIIIISIIWIVFVIIPRKNIEIVKKINIYLYNNYPIVIKILGIRYCVINIINWIKIILLIYVFVDMVLHCIFFLNTRNLNKFYLIRWIIYKHIMFIIVLPMELVFELYKKIVEFIVKPIKVKEYIKWRVYLFVIVIICLILFKISFIYIILGIWIIDTIVNKYINIFKYIKLENLEKKTIANKIRTIQEILPYNDCFSSHFELYDNVICYQLERIDSIIIWQGIMEEIKKKRENITFINEENKNLEFDDYKIWLNIPQFKWVNKVYFLCSWIAKKYFRLNMIIKFVDDFYSVREEAYVIYFIHYLFEEFGVYEEKQITVINFEVFLKRGWGIEYLNILWIYDFESYEWCENFINKLHKDPKMRKSMMQFSNFFERWYPEEELNEVYDKTKHKMTEKKFNEIKEKKKEKNKNLLSFMKEFID